MGDDWLPKNVRGFPIEEYFVNGHLACASCGPATIMRLITKAAGPNTIIVNSTGCMEVVSTKYPTTAWNLPYVHGAFENAAPIASGIHAALKMQGKRDKYNIMVISGDGGTFDIGFGALSAALERGDKFTYVCYDNESYANCLALSTLVMTKEGIKKITEIKKGDWIYAFDLKKYQPVLKRCNGVFDNGKKEVYELETNNHTIKATLNHPFLIVKHNGRGKENNFVWKTLSELKKGDELVVLKRLDSGKSYMFNPIKLSKVGQGKVGVLNDVAIPKNSNPDIMYYLGLYVGDGWIRIKKGEIGFALPEGTEEREKLIAIQTKIFKNKISRKDKYYVYINSVNIAKFIESLGFGKGAKNKTIPGWVFTLPLKEKEAFIEGLLDSDGYKAGSNSLRYVSSSHDLLRRLRLLLQTINYRVGKIHWRKIKKGTKCVKRFLLKDSEGGYICFSKKKGFNNLEKYQSQSRYWDFLAENKFFETENVKSIKKSGTESTLDLRVDGEHNFIADGIVVHNTGNQRSSATPYKAWTTTTPVGKVIKGKEVKKKPINEIIAAHNIPYVATASLSHPKDLFDKVKKSFTFDGPSFINVLAPCILGWKYQRGTHVKLSKKAVDSGLWLLYEIENGKFKLNVEPKMIPVKGYLKSQGRFKHLTEKDIQQIQQQVQHDYDNLKKHLESGKNG